MKHFISVFCILTALALFNVTALADSDLEKRVEHGYADSNGVKIHYASLGKGPLIVMIHGFPDFWYTWRDQMAALSDNFQCVAIDQRGYNLSDKPKGVENYDVRLLVGDVAAVLNLSPRTLHRVLASYGETFGRKLIDARFDVAMRMLESRLFDQVTTAEIGRRAGFPNASHFTRVCRARRGCTPGQLRRARNDPQAEATDHSSDMPPTIG